MDSVFINGRLVSSRSDGLYVDDILICKGYVRYSDKSKYRKAIGCERPYTYKQLSAARQKYYYKRTQERNDAWSEIILANLEADNLQSEFKQFYNLHMRERFINQTKRYTCYNGGLLHNSMPNRYYSMSKSVEQAIKDGNNNIIPYMLRFGMTPKSLKSMFGKGVWKRLCSKGLSENKRLLLSASDRGGLKNKDAVETIKCLSQYSKNNLISRSGFTGMISCHCARYIDYSTQKTADINSIIDAIKDLYWVSSLFPDHEVDINWSVKRCIREHDLLSDRLSIEQIHIEGLGYNDKIPFTLEFNDLCEDMAGVRALTTLQDFLDEGASMRHCVASYAYMCNDRKCLIFHIEKDGPSTLEVKFKNGKPYKGQHKGVRNKKAPNSNESLVKDIISKLS